MEKVAEASQATETATSQYDRFAELKAFDDTKAGVRGLAAAGITKLSRIFVAPPEDRIPVANADEDDGDIRIPVIDLGKNREEVVEAIRGAAEEWGLFQVVGHGVPASVTEGVLEAVRSFHEGPQEEKAALYSRDGGRAVKYQSNIDLFQSRVASWRDTLACRMAPDPPNDDLPQCCRHELLEYAEHTKALGETLLGYFSEALGLDRGFLEEMEYGKGQMLLCHYYPPCPEPELAIGTAKHSDYGFLTILLQDLLGGLQFFHRDRWLDVTPVPGALVINVGDLMQVITNDRFKSVEHRVRARDVGPRISVACFFSTHLHASSSTRVYGPIHELLSEDNPPLYRDFPIREFMDYFFSRSIDGKACISHFRINSS